MTALPTRRVEEWKYSDLARALGDTGFGDGAAKAVAGAQEGVEVVALENANRPAWVAEHYGKLPANVVSAVSLAKAQGGIAMRVRKGVAVEAPLALNVSGEGHVRLLLVLEEGVSLTLFEHFDPAATRNTGFEIVLGANARLDHVRLSPASTAVQVEEISMTVATGAQYHAHFANFGAKLSRLEIMIALEGEKAEAHLSGVSVLATGHADVTTHIAHKVKDTHSTQLFKKVAGGKSRAIYQGKVAVAPGADGVDSRQTAKALLLSREAEADLKPELEILADDVKCAHGAAVGDLDADSLFYLRARGIPEAEARGLLLQAFLEDAVAEIVNIDQRELVRTELLTALKRVA